MYWRNADIIGDEVMKDATLRKLVTDYLAQQQITID
jgi:hypothetical protein